MTRVSAEEQVAQTSPMLQELSTLSIAEGAVDPSVRIASGDIKAEVVHDLAKRLQTDEFYDEIPAGSIPCVCMDCRGRLDGHQVLGGNAAGGTFTLVMADALTSNTFRHPGENSAAHTKRTYAELMKRGYNVGGHDADTAAGSSVNGGCGAMDKLDSSDPLAPSILRYMAKRADDVRQGVQGFGFEVSDALHASLVTNAQDLRETGYATTGRELLEATLEVAGDESIETLTGPQLAVIAVVNTREGQTLNRKKVAAAFGNDYQVFNIDAPTISNGVRVTSMSEAQANDKMIAALYYNVATAAVIVGPSMPIIVR